MRLPAKVIAILLATQAIPAWAGVPQTELDDLLQGSLSARDVAALCGSCVTGRAAIDRAESRAAGVDAAPAIFSKDGANDRGIHERDLARASRWAGSVGDPAPLGGGIGSAVSLPHHMRAARARSSASTTKV